MNEQYFLFTKFNQFSEVYFVFLFGLRKLAGAKGDKKLNN